MKTPNVLRKVRLDGARRMLPVAKVDGRLDWTKVTYQGQHVVVTGGTFYLEWREGERRVRRAIGDSVREAKVALGTQGTVLELRSKGVKVDDAPEISGRQDAARLDGERIADVVTEFLKQPPVKLRKKSRAKYGNALRRFAEFAATKRVTHVSQLDRWHIEDFMNWQVATQGLEISTAIDKAVIALTIMRKAGAEIKMEKGDWPQVTEQQPEIYELETLQALFATADPDELVLWQTFLQTGFRYQEVAYLAWTDFNARKSTLSVTKKVVLGFDPKNYQERTVQIPDGLVRLLEELRARQGKGAYLIFPTSDHNARRGAGGGQRDLHMLDRLKRLAMRAGLNCGRCKGTLVRRQVSCGTHAVCKQFGLHKFRHTYATTQLRDGMDIVSVQRLLGHKDIDSTMKYLRMLEPAGMLMKINASSLARML